MDNNIQDELQRLIQEINRIRINSRNRNTTNRSRRQSENIEVISILRELIQTYNVNIREYQENSQLMLQIIYLLLRETTNSSTDRNPVYETRSRNTTLSDYIYWFTDFTNRLRTVQQTTPAYENVIVSPTAQQIESATINSNYSSETNTHNTNCPITLDEFQEEEPVTLIEHCGHLFRRDAIQNWFQRNVRCPVCRHDIRESSNVSRVAQDQSLPEPSSNPGITEEEIYNTLRSSINNSLSEIINDYNLPMDVSQNFIYTFEFPIIYNDISNNTIRRSN
jgi:hypothetical protein